MNDVSNVDDSDDVDDIGDDDVDDDGNVNDTDDVDDDGDVNGDSRVGNIGDDDGNVDDTDELDYDGDVNGDRRVGNIDDDDGDGGGNVNDDDKMSVYFVKSQWNYLRLCFLIISGLVFLQGEVPLDDIFFAIKTTKKFHHDRGLCCNDNLYHNNEISLLKKPIKASDLNFKKTLFLW